MSSDKGIITGANNSTANDSYSHWMEDERGWKLRYGDGSYATGSKNSPSGGAGGRAVLPGTVTYRWELINGSWFAFGEDGYVITGFFFDGSYNGWFYVDINAGMKTGWIQIDGKWHYFNPGPDGTSC